MTIWILAPFDHEMYGARVDEHGAVYFTDHEKAKDALAKRCEYQRPEYNAYVKSTSVSNEAAAANLKKVKKQNEVLKAARLDTIPVRHYPQQSIKSFDEWLMSPFGKRDYTLVEVKAG